MAILTHRGRGQCRNGQRTTSPSTSPPVRLNAGVGAREKEGVVVAVCPAHHIRRTTVGAAHRDHLAVAVRFTDAVTVDHDAISCLGLHVNLPSSTYDLDPEASTSTG